MFVQTELIKVIDIVDVESSKTEYSLMANFLDLKFSTLEKAQEVTDKLNKVIEENVRN